MERLTEINENGTAHFYPQCFEKCGGIGYSRKCDNCDLLDRVCDKLGEYEDLEQQGKLLKLPCKLRDAVYDIVLCDDGKYRVFEMKVCNINPFGDIRKGKVWNVYIESDYTKAYRSFYDFNKTIFLTREEAENTLNKLG